MTPHPERLRNFTRQARAFLESERPPHDQDHRLHQRINNGLKQLQVIEDEAERRLRPKREPLRLER